MADDSNDKDSTDKENSTYVRKKNIIPGWDNDHLLLTGLGILTAITVYPYARQWVDNIFRSLPQPGQGQLPPGQQLPANGGGVPQQQVLNPPQNKVAYVEPPEQQPKLNPLEAHEKALQDQAAYAAAMEKENLTGSQSISMVPDRSEMKRSKYTYEAGSNVSAGYT